LDPFKFAGQIHGLFPSGNPGGLGRQNFGRLAKMFEQRAGANGAHPFNHVQYNQCFPRIHPGEIAG